MLLRVVPVRANSFHVRVVDGRQKDANSLGHADRIARLPQFVNPQKSSVH